VKSAGLRMYFLIMVLVVVALVAAASSSGLRNVWSKAKTYLHGATFMLVSKDLPKTFSGSNYFRNINVSAAHQEKRTIRVVFVRHGQSVWNSVFNAFGLAWPVRALKALFGEWYLFFTNPLDSYIIDSPLSAKGCQEAEDLCAFVRTAQGKLPLDPTKSVVVCSNLRRAMATAMLGLQPRLSKTRERIVVDSTLQEGSLNIDAQSFSTMAGKIAATPVLNLDTALLLHATFDPSWNAGNKVASADVYKRMDEFIRHVFAADGLAPAAAAGLTNADLEEIVIVGHSGWFRNFFKRFLPSTSTHVSKTKKLKNCGAVVFNLTHDPVTGEVLIDEKTMEVLYRGF
jgi:broad specificity phosphatase PhoE